MKIKVALLVVVLLAAIAAIYPQAGHRRVVAESSQQIGKTIEQYEAQLRVAALKGDAAWFDQRLAEGYTEIDAQGKILTRAALIQAYRTSDLSFDTMNLSEGSARIFNADTVLLVQKQEIAGSLNKQDFSGVFRCTHVWIKQNGDWQLAAAQVSRIPG